MSAIGIKIFLSFLAVLFTLTYYCAGSVSPEGKDRPRKIKYVRSKYGIKALLEMDRSRKSMVKDLKKEWLLNLWILLSEDVFLKI